VSQRCLADERPGGKSLISAEAGALSSAMTTVGPFALTARMTGAAALLGQTFVAVLC